MMISMGKRPDEVVMRLRGAQYRTMMEALEAVSTGAWPSPELREKATALWENLLVEGGHVSVQELQDLKKALEVCPPKGTPKV
jgi:hypothetical protein